VSSLDVMFRYYLDGEPDWYDGSRESRGRTSVGEAAGLRPNTTDIILQPHPGFTPHAGSRAMELCVLQSKTTVSLSPSCVGNVGIAIRVILPLVHFNMSPNLPDSMRAQYLEAYHESYKLRTVPLPKPSAPHDILIKVDAASYCHTDYVLAQGQMPGLPKSFPHIGCHEFAGTVVLHYDCPSKEASALQIGTRVGVPGRSFHACEKCFECKNERVEDPIARDEGGYSVNCVSAENNGLSRDGGFAEYAVVDARQVAPIPDGMTAVETAPLMCAGVTIYGALKRCGLKRGDKLGILGAGGGLGHLGLQYGIKMGYRVLGIEAADAPLALAQDVASKLDPRPLIVDARSRQASDVVQELGAQDGKKNVGEMGLDAVIVLPESQAAFDYGMTLLKTHGTCVVVSFPEKGFHINSRDVVFRDIRIIGSLVGSNRVLREMLNFSAEHGIRALSSSFPLAKLNELVEDYHKAKGGKLVVDMSVEG
jgi:D-arabinose 1-dehydrogenase-like Zn-dependent alcohol dehydrogenase